MLLTDNNFNLIFICDSVIKAKFKGKTILHMCHLQIIILRSNNLSLSFNSSKEVFYQNSFFMFVIFVFVDVLFLFFVVTILCSPWVFKPGFMHHCLHSSLTWGVMILRVNSDGQMGKQTNHLHAEQECCYHCAM